jgi:PAS domain S-box-containing protein
MKRNQRTSAEAAELRRRAAERLNEKTAKTGLPRKTADLKRRLHELQVRQIELARQNEELRQAKQDGEDRYRALFENSLEAILLTVPDGRILAANPAACRLFGRTEAEICRLGRDGLVDPTDPRLAGALAERAQAGKAQREMMFVRNDGVRFPGEVSSGVFKDRNGLLRTSMVIHDITERKRTEDALRESETLFRSLGACLPLGVFLTDAAGHMVYSNPRCRALLGLTLMQAVGEGWARSLHPDDHGRTIQKWFAALREGKEFSDEFRIQNQGGVRWLSARTAPTLSEQGELTGHVATLEDIT